MPGPVQRHDDIVEDEDLQEIALNKGIPYQVHPKTITEDRHPFGIGKFPLQPDEDEYAQYQDAGGIIDDRLHHTIASTERVLLNLRIAPSSLSYTRLIPSP